MSAKLKSGVSFKRLTDEQEEQMEQILMLQADSANWNREAMGYYFIDVTGKHGVYYTLWRFKPSNSPYVNPLQYITNLSIDPIEAAKKARQIAGSIAPIELDASGNMEGLQGKKLHFTFGKYRGHHMGTVFSENPQYFVYLNKLITTDNLKLSKANVEMVKYFVSLHFENATKINREKSKSGFVSEVGDVIKDYKLTVFSVRVNNGYTTFKLVDDSDNKFITYYLPETTKEGDVIVPESFKILEHKEVVGVNYNKIGYFKFAKK